MKKLLKVAFCALALTAFTGTSLADNKAPPPAAGAPAPAPDPNKKDEKKKDEKAPEAGGTQAPKK
jgi:hypothetical protein